MAYGVQGRCLSLSLRALTSGPDVGMADPCQAPRLVFSPVNVNPSSAPCCPQNNVTSCGSSSILIAILNLAWYLLSLHYPRVHWRRGFVYFLPSRHCQALMYCVHQGPRPLRAHYVDCFPFSLSTLYQLSMDFFHEFPFAINICLPPRGLCIIWNWYGSPHSGRRKCQSGFFGSAHCLRRLW